MLNHLCTFEGERTGEKAYRVTCDRSGCAKPAVEYALFVWGATALCRKHLDEDAPGNFKESGGGV